ncbi:MAG: cell division protein FtsL [Caulobacteraceae bacterium]
MNRSGGRGAGNGAWGLVAGRVGGFRVIDLAGLGVFLILALGVYAFKTMAGAQSAETIQVERQITQEKRQVRLLRAELAQLEDPTRIERLSTSYLGMQPVTVTQETTLQGLPAIAAGNGPKPKTTGVRP